LGAFAVCQLNDSLRRMLCAALAVVVCGCEVGPDYIPPWTTVPTYYKEIEGWKPIQPLDAVDRGAWWLIYNDPILDRLERQVEISNQNIAIFEAAYHQSVALVQQARAALFPVFGLTYNAIRQHEGPAAVRTQASGNFATFANGFTNTVVTLETTANWDIDVWGRVRRMIESNAANAQSNAADIANAKLSAQAQLAMAYFNLRAADSLKALLNRLAHEFRRTQTITENQYKQGTVSRYDVVTAQAQVRSTEAQAIGVEVQRAQFEHAIALLIGVPPAQLYIPRGALAMNEVWQIGGTATEILFNGGLRRAQLAGAEASYYRAVANYRQTVLTAFQQVEDALSSLRILARQEPVQQDAVRLSREAVRVSVNAYKAGTVAFTAVVTAEQTLIANEQTALTIRQNRFIASVNLIQALGGGWHVSELPTYDELRHWRSCVDVIDSIRGEIPAGLPPCL